MRDHPTLHLDTN